MTGKGKRILNDDDDDLAPEDAAPAAKLARKGAEDDGDDDIVVCEISKNRRISVRSWRGKIFVDIREFYLKDGKQTPGKKGSYLYYFFISGSETLALLCSVFVYFSTVVS